jgi:hypothetical protein
MELSSIIHRFPTIELSYETFVHKKVDELDTGNEILLAIPYGPKYYIWITFGNAGESHVCYALEINRNKKIVNVRILPDAKWYKKYSHGTVLYATYIQEENVYIVEDIYYIKGVYLRNVNCLTRLQYLYDIFKDAGQSIFYLPHIYTDFSELNKPNYQIHHIQKRSLTLISPYINIAVDRYGKIISNDTTKPQLMHDNAPKTEPTIIEPDPRKPQFRLCTPFWVRAEILPDIYSLYAIDRSDNKVLYGTAHIPSYKLSKSMNSQFRTIRENKCIESAEDSEDEAEFENIALDKYVDVNKCILMNCIYMTKFGKWVPMMNQVDNLEEAVQISKLIKETNINKPNCSSYYNVQKSSFTKGFRYPKETTGRIGGRLSGQHGRNSYSKTQFSHSNRYSSYERTTSKI